MGFVHLYKMKNLNYYDIWNKIILIAFRHVCIAYPARRGHWPCLTARQQLSRQRVGLASPDNSDTHDSNGGRGRRGSGGGVTSYTLAASESVMEDRSRRSYRLHSGGSGGGLETSRGGAGGGPGAGGHRGSPQPESRTGGGAASARTRRAGVCAPLDWGKLPGRATRLLRLEWGEGRRTVTVGSGRRRWR